MLRSTLRTMLVVSLLAGVTGAVVLLHRPGSSQILADASLVDALLPPDLVAEPAAPSSSSATPSGSSVTPTRRTSAAAEYKVLENRRAEQSRQRAERARQKALVRAARDATRNPQAAARLLLADRGWSGQFSCLDSLWTKESGWNYQSRNAGSGAYGIPQSLPGTKMGSVAADWRTNPVTQIRWGLGYIADRYGTPCGAWAHSQSNGWY